MRTLARMDATLAKMDARLDRQTEVLEIIARSLSPEPVLGSRGS